mmetsp:Transcript_79947/g.205645  ORF Transcript_79947/g.205645 Transcript_79947/m.205645 type:complete len:258 (+) Transcript_79947:2034-2807(+)
MGGPRSASSSPARSRRPAPEPTLGSRPCGGVGARRGLAMLLGKSSRCRMSSGSNGRASPVSVSRSHWPLGSVWPLKMSTVHDLRSAAQVRRGKVAKSNLKRHVRFASISALLTPCCSASRSMSSRGCTPAPGRVVTSGEAPRNRKSKVSGATAAPDTCCVSTRNFSMDLMMRIRSPRAVMPISTRSSLVISSRTSPVILLSRKNSAQWPSSTAPSQSVTSSTVQSWIYLGFACSQASSAAMPLTPVPGSILGGRVLG